MQDRLLYLGLCLLHATGKGESSQQFKEKRDHILGGKALFSSATGGGQAKELDGQLPPRDPD